MTELAKLINELRGEKNIETVCDECELSRQTFLLIRRHGRVKLSTIQRLLDYFKPTHTQRLKIIRAWIYAQLGPLAACDIRIAVRHYGRKSGKTFCYFK